MTARAYLDWNATAPLRSEAREAVSASLAACGNPSSVHTAGRAARARIEEARDDVAALVGALPGQVTFTSGGSEANALALSGHRRVLVSAIEHDSVSANAPEAERIAVTSSGLVDLADLECRLRASSEPALVSVMLANNETGVLQPLAEIVTLARDHGSLVHADAAQAAGRIPVDFHALGLDLMSLSAHKLGGPQGVGALIAGPRATLNPLIRGGGQERGRRSGTENGPGIAGFGAAAKAATTDWSAIAGLRDAFETKLRALGGEIFAAEAPRLPNTSCLRLPGILAETLVIALDLAGIAVSAGAACSSGKVRPSPVLRAMGASEEAAREAIRISLGWSTTAEEIAFLTTELEKIRDRLAARTLRAAA